MRSIPALTCAALLAASPVWAQQTVPLTQVEFDQQIVGKTMHAVPVANPERKFVVQLEDGGRAVVSSSFNDVGRWRPFEVAGYCVQWNKIGPPERCYRLARAEGKFVVVDSATGSVSSTFELR